jgi:tetratricopeptide (TPR) repeat protein
LIKDATKDITDSSSSSPEAFTHRARLYIQRKMFNEALTDAQNSIELSPSAVAYMRAGEALEGLGQFDTAANSYKSGLEMDPSNSTLQDRLEKVTLVLHKKLSIEYKNLLRNGAGADGAFAKGQAKGQAKN